MNIKLSSYNQYNNNIKHVPLNIESVRINGNFNKILIDVEHKEIKDFCYAMYTVEMKYVDLASDNADQYTIITPKMLGRSTDDQMYTFNQVQEMFLLQKNIPQCNSFIYKLGHFHNKNHVDTVLTETKQYSLKYKSTMNKYEPRLIFYPVPIFRHMQWKSSSTFIVIKAHINEYLFDKHNNLLVHNSNDSNEMYIHSLNLYKHTEKLANMINNSKNPILKEIKEKSAPKPPAPKKTTPKKPALKKPTPKKPASNDTTLNKFITETVVNPFPRKKMYRPNLSLLDFIPQLERTLNHEYNNSNMSVKSTHRKNTTFKIKDDQVNGSFNKIGKEIKLKTRLWKRFKNEKQ